MFTSPSDYPCRRCRGSVLAEAGIILVMAAPIQDMGTAAMATSRLLSMAESQHTGRRGLFIANLIMRRITAIGTAGGYI